MRSEVKTFAKLMEAKLKQNDWKGGWENETIISMLNRLNEEVVELNEITLCSTNSFEIIDECVDVANFAMMITDLIISKGIDHKMQL